MLAPAAVRLVLGEPQQQCPGVTLGRLTGKKGQSVWQGTSTGQRGKITKGAGHT